MFIAVVLSLVSSIPIKPTYWLGSKKAKGLPYSLPSIGSEADPGVQTVSLQIIYPVVVDRSI